MMVLLGTLLIIGLLHPSFTYETCKQEEISTSKPLSAVSVFTFEQKHICNGAVICPRLVIVPRSCLEDQDPVNVEPLETGELYDMNCSNFFERVVNLNKYNIHGSDDRIAFIRVKTDLTSNSVNELNTELVCSQKEITDNSLPKEKTFCPNPKYQMEFNGVCKNLPGTSCSNTEDCVDGAVCKGQKCECSHGLVVGNDQLCYKEFGGRCSEAEQNGNSTTLKCDPVSGLVCIEGQCSCENSADIYEPSKRQCSTPPGFPCKENKHCVGNSICTYKTDGDPFGSCSDNPYKVRRYKNAATGLHLDSNEYGQLYMMEPNPSDFQYWVRGADNRLLNFATNRCLYSNGRTEHCKEKDEHGWWRFTGNMIVSYIDGRCLKTNHEKKAYLTPCFDSKYQEWVEVE